MGLITPVGQLIALLLQCANEKQDDIGLIQTFAIL